MTVLVVSGPAISVTVLASWSPGAIVFSAGGSFDLKPTLPANTPTTGVFSVAGGTLPPGVTLSTNGVLSCPASTPSESASGITFNYQF